MSITTWNTCRGPALDLLQAERAMKVKGRERSHKYSVLAGAGREERMEAGTLRPTRPSKEGSRRTLWRSPRPRWRMTRSLSLALLVADTEYWSATLSL